jgi:hypothetical protein
VSAQGTILEVLRNQTRFSDLASSVDASALGTSSFAACDVGFGRPCLPLPTHPIPFLSPPPSSSPPAWLVCVCVCVWGGGTVRARLGNGSVDSTVFGPVDHKAPFNLTEPLLTYHLVDGRVRLSSSPHSLGACAAAM